MKRQSSRALAIAKTKYVHPSDEPPQRHSRLYAALTDRDLQIVAAFSLIGLLLVLNLIFRFPNVLAAVADYNQF
jgi:hypothetical protein